MIGIKNRVSVWTVARAVCLLATLIAPYLKADASATYPVGTYPQGITFDGVNIWVANCTNDTVTKLLASTGAIVGTYSVETSDGYYKCPEGIVFDGTHIWVANADHTVSKLLASTGVQVGTYSVALSSNENMVPGENLIGIVFDGTNIWVTNVMDNTVTKLLASTGAIVGTYFVGSWPIGVAFDGVNIWVANFGDSTVTKLLASTGATLATYSVETIPHQSTEPTGIVFDGVDIWLANEYSDSVTKLLGSSGAVVGTYPAGAFSSALAFDGTNVWATNVDNLSPGTVVKLLASTGALVGAYSVGAKPSGFAFDGTNMWVTNALDNTVTKITPTTPQAPRISPAGVVPLDSTASTIQPSEWISIWGSNFASGTTVWNGNFPISLGGTSVQINGKAAFLSLVSPGQINLQAPDDSATGPVLVVVTTSSGSAVSEVNLGQFGPSFSLLDTTHVAGIILRSDGSGAYDGGTYDILGPTGGPLGYPTVAAKAGDSIELFGVGFGPTTPAVPAGKSFSGAAPTTNNVQIAISGTTVIPSFAGMVSAGLYQFNLTIPAGLGTGDHALVATVGGVKTQSGVAISLQ